MTFQQFNGQRHRKTFEPVLQRCQRLPDVAHHAHLGGDLEFLAPMIDRGHTAGHGKQQKRVLIARIGMDAGLNIPIGDMEEVHAAERCQTQRRVHVVTLADHIDFVGVCQARQQILHFVQVLRRKNLVIMKIRHWPHVILLEPRPTPTK